MHEFSMFEKVSRIHSDSRIPDFGRLTCLSRCEFEGRESFFFTAEEPSLEYACLMIENLLMLRMNRSGRAGCMSCW